MHTEQILRAYKRLIFRAYKRLTLRPTPKYPRVALDFQDSMSKEYRQQENWGLTPSRTVFFPNSLTASQILPICATTTDTQSTGLCAWEELHSCTSPCKIRASSHPSFVFITYIKFLFGCTFADSHSATFWCRAESWYGTILHQ